MYEIETTNQFDKHAIRCINRKYDFSLLENVISLLESNGKLPAKYKTHPLEETMSIIWNVISRPTGC